MMEDRVGEANPNRSHGLWDTPVYRSWCSMLQRCRNPNAPNWEYYGGRGITICDEWLHFEGFYADMGERPAGLTLDRIDVDGNYEPGNVRWATPKEQRHNQRPRSHSQLEGET